ncbi:MAG TPA: hypothetical protein VIV11_06575 [Kofleriaceae bacterium]
MSPFKCVVCVFALCVVACAGDDSEVDLENRDPRCVSACTAEEPRYEGVGRVCNTASRAQCLDECETRIANVMPICQSCLVEESCFGPEGCSGDDGLGGFCDNTMCTITSEFGSCTYMTGDMAGQLRCMQQVNPRREVSCTSEFRPTTECASVCG